MAFPTAQKQQPSRAQQQQAKAAAAASASLAAGPPSPLLHSDYVNVATHYKSEIKAKAVLKAAEEAKDAAITRFEEAQVALEAATEAKDAAAAKVQDLSGERKRVLAALRRE